MKKIISFSLWGNNPKYTVGAVKNAILAKEVYPDWQTRFFVHQDVDKYVVKDLDSNNAEVFVFNTPPDWGASLFRLLPISDDDASHVIFRDCDSRLSQREKAAVDEWIASNKSFHIMRDHPYHGGFPILAGMFGSKTKTVKDILEKIAVHIDGKNYHTDQAFIQGEIWPLAEKDSVIHDEIFSQLPFPLKRVGLEYVGEPLDENDKPCNPIHREALKGYI